MVGKANAVQFLKNKVASSNKSNKDIIYSFSTSKFLISTAESVRPWYTMRHSKL